MTSLASASSMRAASAVAEKPGEHHAVHDAQPRARQHRDDRLGHHRHVDRDPITGDQPEVGQRVGGLADLGEQIRVRQLPAVAGFALPADRHPIAVAGLDVAVDAVVGDVELAADEPLGERRLRPVQYLVERGVPGQPVGLLRPERQPVGLGLAVEVFSRVGLRGELGGRRVCGLNFGVRVRHICERSHRRLHRRWHLTARADNEPHGSHVEDRRRFWHDRRCVEAPRQPVECLDAVRGDPADDPGDLEPGVAGLVVPGADRCGHGVAVAEPACLRAGGNADELGGQGHLRREAVAEGA